MTSVEVTHDSVHIHLSRLEKLAALSGDIVVPRESVVASDVIDDPLHAVRGLRGPGLGVPNRIKLGTWRRRGGRRQFVAVRRDQPAVLLTLRGQRYDSLLVGTDAPDRLLAQLTAN
jgi:hypothetical protein